MVVRGQERLDENYLNVEAEAEHEAQRQKEIKRDVQRRLVRTFAGTLEGTYNILRDVTGELNEIPQRLLMPSVQDANLWQVRVRVSTLLSLLFMLSEYCTAGEGTRYCVQLNAESPRSRIQREAFANLLGLPA